MLLRKTTAALILLVLVALFVLLADHIQPVRSAITETFSTPTENVDAAARAQDIQRQPMDPLNRGERPSQPALSATPFLSHVPSTLVTPTISRLPTPLATQKPMPTATLTSTVTAKPTQKAVPTVTQKPTAMPTVTPTKKAPPTSAPTPAPTATQAPTPVPTPGALPHPQEAYWIEEIFRLTNLEREKAGVPPLQPPSAVLLRAAAIRAEECAIDGSKYYSHTRPDGSPWYTVLQDISMKACGENIAFGTAGYYQPADFVKGWMDSEGHKKNILNPAFTTMGVGIMRSCDAEGQPGYDVLVQLFIGN